MVQRIRQAHGRRGLAFARRRRRDGGDEDQLAVRPALQRLDIFHRQLGLVVAIGLEIFGFDAKPLARDQVCQIRLHLADELFEAFDVV